MKRSTLKKIDTIITAISIGGIWACSAALVLIAIAWIVYNW